MCHDKDYGHLFDLTKSTNFGKGICCKPDADVGLCSSTNPRLVCSPPSYDPESSSLLLTDDDRNYQMFAFCPGIDQRKCGISANSSSTDFALHATTRPQVIQAYDLRYNPGDQFTREYDACHYELTFNKTVVNETVLEEMRSRSPLGRISIYFHLLQNTDVNVFIYEGADRMTTSRNLTLGNVPAGRNKAFMAPHDKGILVVVVPD